MDKVNPIAYLKYKASIIGRPADTKACNTVIAHIEALEAERDALRAEVERLRAQVPVWVPVSEDTPLDVEMLLGWWQEWPDRRWEQSVGKYGCTKGGWISGCATHCMPLPQPPKENSNG